MHEEALKDFIAAAVDFQPRMVLFVFATKQDLDAFWLEFVNAADDRDLPVLVRRPSGSADIDRSRIHVGVARPGFSYQYSGIPWSSIHGIEYLEPEDRARLQAFVREIPGVTV